MEIWINPNYSQCHSALSLLDAEGARYTLRNYLETPPTTLEIEEVLRRLGLEPWDIAASENPWQASQVWRSGRVRKLTAFGGSRRWRALRQKRTFARVRLRVCCVSPR